MIIQRVLKIMLRLFFVRSISGANDLLLVALVSVEVQQWLHLVHDRCVIVISW